MPTYEYRCMECRKRVSIFQAYKDYGHVPVHCPHCESENLERILGRIRFARSEESRLDSLTDPSAWGDLEDDDPRTMARMMRKMGNELGEEMPPEFDEVVDRLESGESPDEIEKNLPEMGLGGDDFGG